MKPGTIILLNGGSSSGKTTLAKALAARLPGYFPLSLDDFDLLIERMEDRDNGRVIQVETEIFFHKTIAMFSDRGVNLIVDHILHDRLTRSDALEVLAAYPVLFVGVRCPVEELERREAARGDRHIGQGRGQLDFVHRQEVYDVEVDTCRESTDTCAGRIVGFLKTGCFPDGWLRTQAIRVDENRDAPR